MTREQTKEQALEAIDDELARWEALVREVGPARLEEPIEAGGWSFKDISAHLTGWRERTLQRLEAAAQEAPEPPSPWPSELTSDDEINAWMHARDRTRPAAEILDEAQRSFARLRAAVAALSEGDLDDPARFAWMEGRPLAEAIIDRDFFGHLREEHEPAIRAWLRARAG